MRLCRDKFSALFLLYLSQAHCEECLIKFEFNRCKNIKIFRKSDLCGAFDNMVVLLFLKFCIIFVRKL